MMKRLLREPLLHFLLLGAGLFIAYGLVPKSSGDAASIVISRGQVENLVSGFTRTWQRAPTQQELSDLLAEHVREEVYYREALVLGLDRDDTVVRRRLRQKMEFVSNDVVAQSQPTEAELTAYLQSHPEKFRTPDQFAFNQVYLDPAKHGEHLARDAEQLLARLNHDSGAKDSTDLGDAIMLESSYTNVSTNDVASQFGAGFSAKLAGLTPGHWQGPVESGYGVHLVLLREHAPGHLPELTQARDAVAREWTNARRLEANEKFFQQLLKRYRVTIEQPTPAEDSKKVAAAQ